MVLSRLGNLTLQLPDTESLQQAGIQEFSEDVASKRPPTMLNPTVQKLAKTIQALETQQSNHSNTASNMVTLGRGLQSLPKKMVDQIRSNQYVDFTELPPAKGLAKTIPQTVVGDGQLILVQTTDLTDSRRIIPSLAVWLQCFSLYIAALSPPQDRLCDLMAYQAFIARCSVKYNWPSWVVYDQNFRMEAANQPDRLWAQSDSDIYTQAFTNQLAFAENWCSECQSLDHARASCPRKPPNQPRPPSPNRGGYHKSRRVCTFYNNNPKGDCKYGRDCYFRHVCSACGGRHPQVTCQSGQLKRRKRDQGP